MIPSFSMWQPCGHCPSMATARVPVGLDYDTGPSVSFPCVGNSNLGPANFHALGFWLEGLSDAPHFETSPFFFLITEGRTAKSYVRRVRGNSG